MEKIKFKTEFIDKELPVILVEVAGYIDQANCDQLQKIFDQLFESDHFNLILDFTDLSYMSSAGWGILVGDVKRFKDKGGNIKICNMRPEVFEVYQMLEFYHILDEFYSIEEALSSFKGTPSIKKISQKKKVIEDQSINRLVKNDFETGIKGKDEKDENDTYKKIVSLELDEKDIRPSSEDLKTSPSGFVHPTVFPENNRGIVQDTEFNLNIKKLPLQEKIKKIVAMYPLISVWQMQKMLRHDDFGNVRIGIFRLFRNLKELNLENKVKRYRYYRSC
jgi:anti-sigma B factor antagonist